MAEKKIARNQGDSGRVNLSGSELSQFGTGVGENIEVDIAESKAIAHAMIDSKDAEAYIIISKPTSSNEDDDP